MSRVAVPTVSELYPVRPPATDPPEAVDHPAHYQAGGMEVIDVIDAFGLGFNRGSALKYLLRAGRKKNEIEDLEKCLWYLTREVQTLKRNTQKTA